MSQKLSSGMTVEPNALMAAVSSRRFASRRCQLSWRRSSWPCIKRFFNCANRDGKGALVAPGFSEGKTLDILPTGLGGRGEAEEAVIDRLASIAMCLAGVQRICERNIVTCAVSDGIHRVWEQWGWLESDVIDAKIDLAFLVYEHASISDLINYQDGSRT